MQGYPAFPVELWNEPGWDEAFNLVTDFGSPVTWSGMQRRIIDFLPIDYPQYVKQPEEARTNTWSPDVFLGIVSPPDDHGYCSFGGNLWYHKELAQNAKVFIAEVDPSYIRTYGDNFIHISEIDYLVPETEPFSLPARHPTMQEESGVVEVIAAHAAGLVRDGDTIQMGVGAIAELAAEFLQDRNDLGIHSEAVFSPMLELVRRGVVTGKYKTMHRGKVVAAMLGMMGPNDEDLKYAHNNPVLELYSVTYVNSVPLIAGQFRQVAINNALAIDLTGQVTGSSLGPTMYSGLGGQFSFSIGAMYSPGGRSIVTLPATARGGTVSRIVPQLAAGTIVSVPRYFVDYVITEYGITNLQGRTQRQRAEALIEIAAPDFRPELRKAAKGLYWP
jgi:acyl-CoA hydrolase